MPSTDRPDAVFIGAGINALGAAFLLGRAGWRVLVVERNDAPGGAIRTMELTLPGFRHDIGAMNLNLFASSPFLEQHRGLLAEKGFDLVTADHSAGSVFAGDRFLGITTDLAANLRSIARFSKTDVDAWKAWTADFEACAPFLFRIFGSPAPAPEPLGYAFGDDTDVPAPVRPVLRGLLLDSLRANLTMRFESEEVRALVAAWGLHPDYAPDSAGGCWYPFLETNVDQRRGIAIARGGSGRLIHALVEQIREDGGEVRTGTTVEKILIENARAVGIHVAGDQRIGAARAVVASVTPTALLQLTDGQLPAPEAERAPLALWPRHVQRSSGPVRPAGMARRRRPPQLLRPHRPVARRPCPRLSGEPGRAVERPAVLRRRPTNDL